MKTRPPADKKDITIKRLRSENRKLKIMADGYKDLLESYERFNDILLESHRTPAMWGSEGQRGGQKNALTRIH